MDNQLAMSIFISTLAFEDHEIVNMSQISVLLASVTAAVLGGIWFITVVPDSIIADIDPPIDNMLAHNCN